MIQLFSWSSRGIVEDCTAGSEPRKAHCWHACTVLQPAAQHACMEVPGQFMGGLYQSFAARKAGRLGKCGVTCCLSPSVLLALSSLGWGYLRDTWCTRLGVCTQDHIFFMFVERFVIVCEAWMVCLPRQLLFAPCTWQCTAALHHCQDSAAGSVLPATCGTVCGWSHAQRSCSVDCCGGQCSRRVVLCSRALRLLTPVQTNAQ
ncbi:hypothetical protein COO60DRAFT_616769 [Scenedesmus sp. NREL 46B-D3]|nr:hypothetical protein COO60DRAFT_616769 [Scenedesmus sp. NREL 46B-D3]